MSATPSVVRRGFTLVELLVVIGIIALLIGILLPSLSKAREQSKKTACLSNLRQLSMAALNYAANNKSALPYHNAISNATGQFSVAAPLDGITNANPYTPNWVGAIYPYAGKSGKVMACPSHRQYDELSGTGTTANFEQVTRTYQMNGVVSWNSGRNLKNAAETMMFRDIPSSVTSGASVTPRWNFAAATPTPASGAQRWSGFMYFASPTDTNAGPTGKLTDGPHGRPGKDGGQCLAFVDGHAAFVSTNEITCLTFGLEPNDADPRFYEAAVTGYTAAGRMFKQRVK